MTRPIYQRQAQKVAISIVVNLINKNRMREKKTENVPMLFPDNYRQLLEEELSR